MNASDWLSGDLQMKTNTGGIMYRVKRGHSEMDPVYSALHCSV